MALKLHGWVNNHILWQKLSPACKKNRTSPFFVELRAATAHAVDGFVLYVQLTGCHVDEPAAGAGKGFTNCEAKVQGLVFWKETRTLVMLSPDFSFLGLARWRKWSPHCICWFFKCIRMKFTQQRKNTSHLRVSCSFSLSCRSVWLTNTTHFSFDSQASANESPLAATRLFNHFPRHQRRGEVWVFLYLFWGAGANQQRWIEIQCYSILSFWLQEPDDEPVLLLLLLLLLKSILSETVTLATDKELNAGRKKSIAIFCWDLTASLSLSSLSVC